MVRPAAGFARDILSRQRYIRLGLLEEMWAEAGGLRRHLRIALRELGCQAKRHAAYPGELFVYPQERTGEGAPAQETHAPVVRERRGEQAAGPPRDAPTHQRSQPPKVDGIYQHGPLCDCEWCSSEAAPEPSYGRAAG